MKSTTAHGQKVLKSGSWSLMMRRVSVMLFVVMLVCGMGGLRTAEAATTAQVNEAVDNGIAWLLAEQQGNGSFGTGSGNSDGYTTANTGFAVAALIHHAEKLGKTPLGTYVNATAVQNGLNYLFSSAVSDAAGIYWNIGGDDAYQTGIPLMAIARSGAPAAVVSGGVANGMTYKQVAQSVVNWLETAQGTTGGYYYMKSGGTGVAPNPGATNTGTDQSSTGWAAMGVGYAIHSMGCSVSATWINRLSSFNTYIQGSDGGAGYNAPNSSQNTYKTGHLLYDLGLVGKPLADTAVQNALAFIDSKWNDTGSCAWGTIGGWRGGGSNTPCYNAMFSASKGLNEYEITSFKNVTNWYDDFTTVIYANKINDGGTPVKWHWLSTGGLGDNVAIRATASALLTMLKASSNPLPGSIVAAPANGRYGVGQVLSFTSTFTDKVTVTGTPRLKLDIGGVTRYANYVSGSNSTALTYQYTIQAGENDLNGIALIAPFELNNGTIKDQQLPTPLDVPLTFTPPDTTALLVDTTAPTVNTQSASVPHLLESGSVTLSYSFSEAVSGVTAANFSLVTASLSGTAAIGTPACSSGSAPCTTWNVAVSNVGSVSSGVSGTLHLDLINGNNIVDSANPANAMLAGSTSTGTSVTVWKTITIATVLPIGVLTVPYNNSVTAVGGNGSFTYTRLSGSIPSGLTFTNGVFSGTPTGATPTTYTFTIRATDGNGLTGDQSYSVLVVNTHNVTTSIPNGLSTPASIAVTHGFTTTLKIDSSTGYHITGISGCGGITYTAPAYTNATSGVTTYNFLTGTINADCLVTATTSINQYDITATPDTHSNISGFALNTPHTYSNINYNASQSVTFTSDTGYHLTGITNSCSGTGSATYSNVVNGPWTTSATFTPSGTISNGVAANCGISAVSSINVYSITPSIVIVP